MNKQWTDTGWDDYLYWQNKDKHKIKKINLLIRDIERIGELEGIGKPERLKGDLAGWCSRRIDEINRLVYKVENDALIIAQCRGHYNDN